MQLGDKIADGGHIELFAGPPRLAHQGAHEARSPSDLLEKDAGLSRIQLVEVTEARPPRREDEPGEARLVLEPQVGQGEGGQRKGGGLNSRIQGERQD